MWDTLIVNPMTNALLVLYDLLGNNFFLSIAVFTVITRLITLPLNIRQQRSTMRMQKMQPQVQQIQKKYRDNPQKMQEEFAKIGYNPTESLAGCLPLLVTFPIFIGLYRAIILTLGATPLAMFELQQRVYPGIDLTSLLPITNKFLWMNLGQPDPYFVLPILVFVTMFVSQKLITPSTSSSKNNASKKGDKKQEPDNPMASMTQSMQYTMPLMFGFFSLTFPAGLSLYFVISNLIGIGQGYLMRQATQADEEEKAVPPPAAAAVDEEDDEPEEDEAGDEFGPGSSADRHIRSVSDKGSPNGKPPARGARKKSKRKRRAG